MDILQDLRPGLGTPLAHHSLISKIIINFIKRNGWRKKL